ncbi:MAG: hypothetical protein HY073_02370 [Deltaproteobacteria bacterium]|nr:hypothetical protein [Deltaproteobacteria bacterium]
MEPMEEIWKSAAKAGKDGKSYIFLKGSNDLGYLYATGFVDVRQHSFKDWVNSFNSSRLKDGSYAVSHEQWLEKKKFHFEGFVAEPFDPMQLEDRELTESEAISFLRETVLPHTVFDEKAIPQLLTNLKNYKKLVNGKVKLDKKLKQEVVLLLHAFPSPMRTLEVMVQNMRMAQEGRAQTSFKSGQDRSQKSQFAAGLTAQEITRKRLSEIAKEARPTEGTVEGTGKPSISLKELKKKAKTTGRV